MTDTEPADDTMQGHWLLARLGKRVLRPGGVELTRALLAAAELPGADVVELAPGLGRTATEILEYHPRSYRGVDSDPAAAQVVRELVAGQGTVHVADAAGSGLPGASADVVIGEAVLTMQGERAKRAVVSEAARLLRPGGRYAVHELALTPDTVPEEVRTTVRQRLARTIRVNARPLTRAEWCELLAEHGMVVEHVQTAPMALLQPRRLLADEGLVGTLRFAGRLLTRPAARRRVMAMRSTFRAHRQHLVAVGLVARKL